jgi:hypothetical protein
MRKPSSLLGIREHGVVIDEGCSGTYFVLVLSDGGFRSEIVLNLLSDDLSVDIPGWYPVLVLGGIGRHI